MPTLIESTLVVVVELRPAVRVAASWTGRGRYVSLHAPAGSGDALLSLTSTRQTPPRNRRVSSEHKLSCRC